jgi:hypothetical protein
MSDLKEAVEHLSTIPYCIPNNQGDIKIEEWE